MVEQCTKEPPLDCHAKTSPMTSAEVQWVDAVFVEAERSLKQQLVDVAVDGLERNARKGKVMPAVPENVKKLIVSSFDGSLLFCHYARTTFAASHLRCLLAVISDSHPLTSHHTGMGLPTRTAGTARVAMAQVVNQHAHLIADLANKHAAATGGADMRITRADLDKLELGHILDDNGNG